MLVQIRFCGVVESLSLEVFKKRVNVALKDVVSGQHKWLVGLDDSKQRSPKGGLCSHVRGCVLEHDGASEVC